MTLRRTLLVGLVLLALAGWLAPPVRWEVEGLSMAPGLMPGDVVQSGWFPPLDRFRRPRRFERWTLAAPDGAIAVKRVWGLPGEEIGIVDGDVTVAGRLVAKPPRALAEMALPVMAASRYVTDAEVRLVLPDPVFDDMPFAPDERRVLLPVSDVGVAAVIAVERSDHGDARAEVEVFVASRGVRVRLPRPGRHAVVAGRLDGAFVAAAWAFEPQRDVRSCLPPGGLAAWPFHQVWDRAEPVMSCAVRIVASSTGTPRVVIEDVVGWRDVHHMAPASGTTRWRLATDEWFVLGDYPGGSRDSRHWGPVLIDRFRQRLAPSSR
jgi:type IV secretory pathway protease TraF